jgi:hypothetical protein
VRHLHAGLHRIGEGPARLGSESDEEASDTGWRAICAGYGYDKIVRAVLQQPSCARRGQQPAYEAGCSTTDWQAAHEKVGARTGVESRQRLANTK